MWHVGWKDWTSKSNHFTVQKNAFQHNGKQGQTLLANTDEQLNKQKCHVPPNRKPPCKHEPSKKQNRNSTFGTTVQLQWGKCHGNRSCIKEQ